MAGALALVAILAFVSLLIQKEMVSTASTGWQHALARGLNIALMPLGLAFLMIAGALIQVLQ